MTINASYIMTIDSDDCVSNKVCAFVSKNGTDSISSWYFKKGCLYPEGKSYSYLNLKKLKNDDDFYKRQLLEALKNTQSLGLGTKGLKVLSLKNNIFLSEVK